MSRPWDAERTMSPELASELIAAQFPELAPVHVEPLGQGWDNAAFRVNETLVFRSLTSTNQTVELKNHERTTDQCA